VIVRIMGEGQWRLDDDALPRLNALDEETESAVAAGDEDALHATLQALAAEVRRAGAAVGESELVPSDLVIPPVDLTLDEARELLYGEGLIPDL
jgi:hypothetical protein